MTVLFALASAFAACTLSNEGVAPPTGEFHYPIVAQLSPDAGTTGPSWLYVVNSDFNLKYNGGRVNVVDLNRVRACMRDTGGIQCTANGDCPTASTCVGGLCRCTTDANCNITPAHDDPRVCTHTCVAAAPGDTNGNVCAAPSTGQIESNFLSRSSDASVQINPFATDARIRQPLAAGGPSRLYITVRGDGTLTWIDAQDDHLTCFASDGGPLCDQAHRIGHQQADSPRGLILPPLPVSLDVNADGNILVVHQESPRARASLFFDSPTPGQAPALIHWLGDLSPNLDAIVRVPSSVPTDLPHYYVFSRLEPVVSQLRVQNDGGNSFLFRAHADLIQDLATDVGIRAARIDPCDDYRMTHGLTRHMYATARPNGSSANGSTFSPEQLIDFDITDPENIIAAHIMTLPTGASQLEVIPPTHGCGTGDVMAYTVSYDARKMYVIDVDHWEEADEIRTERGPNFPVLDSANRHLYLVNFAAMVIQVIDVDETHPTYNQVLFTIGDPVLPDPT